MYALTSRRSLEAGIQSSKREQIQPGGPETSAGWCEVHRVESSLSQDRRRQEGSRQERTGVKCSNTGRRMPRGRAAEAAAPEREAGKTSGKKQVFSSRGWEGHGGLVWQCLLRLIRNFVLKKKASAAAMQCHRWDLQSVSSVQAGVQAGESVGQIQTAGTSRAAGRTGV